MSILKGIENLDMSGQKYNVLTIPEAILKCSNLKFLDLTGHKNIKWKQNNKLFEDLPTECKIHITIKKY